jgi:molybdopterin converting factor subunit 1
MPNEEAALENQRIQVKVKFFAAPREALDRDEIQLELPEGTTVEGLLDLLKEQYPVLRSYMRFLSVAVNRAYVGMGTELHDGDVIACLPPVGGG